MGIMNILESAKRLSFVTDALARVGISAEHIETAHAAGNTDFVAASVAGVDSVKAANDGLAQAAKKITESAATISAEKVASLGFKPQPGASSDAPPNDGESAKGGTFTDQRAAQIRAQYPDLGKR